MRIFIFLLLLLATKMNSVVIVVLLIVVFIDKNTVRLSNLKMHDINAILSRKSRTTAHVPHQSGISVCIKLIL